MKRLCPCLPDDHRARPSPRHAQNYVDNARVAGVEPQYESVNVPRQECSSRWVGEPRRVGGATTAAPFIGGVAGALLGQP